ncbi:L,D-transpeptidase, partial [Rhodococcus hoagii]|nr:L,D-transpeptidase [Prescottella equi]
MREQGIRVNRTRLLMVVAALLGLTLLAGCTIPTGDAADGTPVPAGPVAQVVEDPAPDAQGVNPAQPISVSVTQGTLQDVALTNASGK